MANQLDCQKDLELAREKGEQARGRLNMEVVRAMQYMPREISAWHEQYFYKTIDGAGNVIPLTTKLLDHLLSEPYCGQQPKIEAKFVKKCVLIGDAVFLEEFLAPFLIKCEKGMYFSIFPHNYTVPCNDPLVRQASIGFVEIINRSRNAFTIGSLLADRELFFEMLKIQPDIISISTGLVDIKLENTSWQFSQIPGEFVKMFQELVANFQAYFIGSGRMGSFSENVVYTFNMLPIYTAADSGQHNRLEMAEVRQHENLWGTSYFNITRDQYKWLADEINKRLHKCEEDMFVKYNLVLLNPTPKWSHLGLHVDLKSGLPFPEDHRKIIENYLYCMARVVCCKTVCTLGQKSSRAARKTDKQLFGGCTFLYCTQNN